MHHVDGQVLNFSLDETGEYLVDSETGTLWDITRGVDREGEFQGKGLLQLPYLPSFDWA